MARIGRCQTENMQIKRLVGCLNVCKEDFNQLHAPPGRREEAMLSVGSRLLNSLCPPDLVASAARGEAVARTQTGQCVGTGQMGQRYRAGRPATSTLASAQKDNAHAHVILDAHSERLCLAFHPPTASSPSPAHRLLQTRHAEESQVAAAALVACGNDPAAAIVALMEAADKAQHA